jgi:hypothetical protein
MKSTLLPFVMIMTLLFLLPTGCRKEDSVSQLEQADAQLMRDFLSDDYFATASEYYNPPPADPSAQTTTESRTKKSMTASLKDYFAKNPKEVKKINQKYGYPVWEHAYNNTDEVGDFYFLPIAKTNKNQIEAILYTYKVHNTSSLGFKWLERKNLKTLKEKKDIKKNSSGKFTEINRLLATIQTAYFEQEMFGTIDCEFNEYFKKSSNLNTTVSARTCYYDIEVTTVTHCTSGGGFTSCEVTTYIDGYIWCNGTSTEIHEEQAPPNDDNGGNSESFITENCNSVDTINIGSSFTNCTVLNCIYQKFLNSGQPRFCHNIYRYNYNDKLHLNISAQNIGGADGSVIMSSNGVDMKFHTFHCNSNDHIRVAETLLHESAHAKFRYDLFKGTSFSDNVYRENFRLWVMNKYGVPYNSDHQLMVKTYMDIVARDLWELNDRKFDPSYYLAWTWEGLENDNPGVFSQEVINGWKAKQTIVNNNNPFKCR